MKNFENKKGIVKELGPYLHLSWQLVITILLLTLLGWWLDKKFDTSPMLILIFSILGVLTGMYNFFRTVLELGRKGNKKKK